MRPVVALLGLFLIVVSFLGYILSGRAETVEPAPRFVLSSEHKLDDWTTISTLKDTERNTCYLLVKSTTHGGYSVTMSHALVCRD